jgi:hypothetical protein
MIAETNAIVSEDINRLKEIQNKHCNIAIWKRELAFDASVLLANNPKSLRLSVQADRSHSQLSDTIQRAGYVDGPATCQLLDDIADLCSLFQAYVETSDLEIRLEIVDNDACRKFHSDFVTLRLISTYLGPGTQWLDIDQSQKIDAIDLASINEMTPGDVGIFKGRLSTSEPGIHRSPPIAGTGQKRLVLVINPITNNDW